MSFFSKIVAGLARIVGVAHEVIEKVEADVGAVIDAIVDIPPEEVAAKLDAARGDRNLDWRHSIVDLLKVIGDDWTLEARSHLYHEVGLGDDYAGKPTQNIALHKKILDMLSQRGLRLPA